MKSCLICAFILSLFLNSMAFARDVYQFPDEQSRNRFESLTHNLRCLVCQNQTIADSQAPLACDLREKIHEQILAKQTDEQITSFLTQRYGEFILYTPPLEPKTWLLWFLPFFLVILGLFGLVCMTKTALRFKKPLNYKE